LAMIFATLCNTKAFTQHKDWWKYINIWFWRF